MGKGTKEESRKNRNIADSLVAFFYLRFPEVLDLDLLLTFPP
jgi:hypothetical protein